MRRFGNGHSVVVTGAAGGIGSAVAFDLAAVGYRVLAVDRDATSLATAQQSSTSDKLPCETFVADSRDEAAMREAIELVGSWDEALWGSVLCAGFTRRLSILDTTREDLSELSSTNFEGTTVALKATGAALGGAGTGGSIVAITSINALRPLAEQPIYSATKAAIESLVASAAVEFGQFGVRVNAIAPGAIITPMNPGLDQQHEVRRSIPLRRVGTPEDLTGAVRFLLGPDSSYITGATLTVDGGLVHVR